MSLLEKGIHRVRVYWEDTDAGGIVYHTSYLRFMERGRTELLRAGGLDQTHLAEATGVTIAVRRMTVDFLASARLDDLLEVHTTLAEVRGASLLLRQSITLGERTLITADVVVACVRDGKPCRVPDAIKAAFASG